MTKELKPHCVTVTVCGVMAAAQASANKDVAAILRAAGRKAKKAKEGKQ